MKGRLLIVDDDTAHLSMLETLLKSLSYAIECVKDGADAIRQVQKNPYDLVLMDVRMANLGGMEALKEIKHLNPAIPVIIMTAYSSVDKAVEAMRLGADDYLTKPLNFEELKLSIERVTKHLQLSLENNRLKEQLLGEGAFSGIIGTSSAIREVIDTAKIAAPTDANILISGESGTGKELFAKAIHKNSKRKESPLISVNCAALSETLLESELFGHEKGAFTGADKPRAGLFISADKGTIFLDEIGEIPLSMQVKLLRVLQEKEIQKVGSDQVTSIDVRVIVATNKNLEEEVEKGSFRQDLFYRLNVINVKVPPLRDRTDDIPLLAQKFLNRYTKENKKEIKGFTPMAMDALVKYGWPGNVRELENIIERAIILCLGQYICEKDLPSNVLKDYEPENIARHELAGGGKTLNEIESIALIGTLKQTKGNKTEAARILNITRTTLNNKLKRHNLDLDKILPTSP
ncbi:two-component system response regulator [Desulfobacter hydrogenophilus]|uniref:Sigma-54-dependent Fis family transcriptional regulator n=1 Tax=Desulfobacter hydrogenophilus TaxID=2291 RepID=A0A328FAJ4_9BACT|nr:sigma-54 dependent transcriptional regulator [Desulfobacter hydrogenophilus]NDY71338.1 sigma-54-dependent Fis family transcriptional regulator [Desulfobacter hydrogenophilus]QBH12263.1 sigma-54-dependent Fis family transcriptional regulator [Desulfobacter hydrogenophilus]RAM01226.1 two-component system response regulator [Desulfobacter hydrogenophilus]